MISPGLFTDDEHPGAAPADRETVHAEVPASALAELAAAVSMLTRLPIRRDAVEGTGAAAFGIVGGLMGVAASFPLVALGAWIAPLSAILALAVLAIASGAVHLDGLADTADALMAVGPDGAERARTDPSIGVGGVVALALVLGVDVAALAAIAAGAGPVVAGIVCVAAGSASRAVPVILARLTRTLARPTGLGGWFAARVTTRRVWIAIASALVIVFGGATGLGWAGGGAMVAVAGVIGGLGGLGLGLVLVRLRGRLDGDLLGASVELAFALTVVAASVLMEIPA